VLAKIGFPCCERSNHFIEDVNFETIKCQVSFFYGHLTFFLDFFGPAVEVLVFIGIFVQVYQRWKFWSFRPRLLLLATLAMNTNGESQKHTWELTLCRRWFSGRAMCRPVTSLGHQWGRGVFWEGPKFFKLCPIFLNYVQHIFPGGS